MSIAAAENAGPGPCSIQDPLWVKMSAVASNITKKRKKSDAKPQSQINKCLNEKRRRTQENLYIDELAELISATDMSSGKTDKCQILQRTVDQIRHINQQSGSKSHAVQQGEVSSSNPSILSNDQVGPILLEALDGFLFVVNGEGRIEYVTDNISDYINYTKNDVLGKDIYNIIHHGDHSNFMPNILPMSVAGWSSEIQQQRNRTFECRFLLKPPDEKEETMEEKQQRVSKYETMQICSALLPNHNDRLEGSDVSSESSDMGPCVMCVARRVPLDEKRIGQFTFKLDTSGKILAVDTSWLSSSYSKYLCKDLINTTIQDLCHPHDLNKLTIHLNDTLQNGESMSPMYRLLIASDKFLSVQTKSKLFKDTVTNNFIMATHSIFRDNDGLPLDASQLSSNKGVCVGHSATNRSLSSSSNNNNNVGGPLMSVGQLNGQSSGIQNRGSSPTVSSGFSSTDVCNSLGSTSNAPFNQFPSNMDLEFEFFPTSTWELDSGTAGWGDPSNSRPESRASTQGQSCSRPPSQPSTVSPKPRPTCSPLQGFSPVHGFSNSFSFSPLQETQCTPSASSSLTPSGTSCFEEVQNQQHSGKSQNLTATTGCQGLEMPNVEVQQQQVVQASDSARLRNLLTKGSSTTEEPNQETQKADSEKPSQNRILKILLNQPDEDDYPAEHIGKLRTSPCVPPKSQPPETTKPSAPPGNNMLLQLLNEKSDDDDEETRAGLKKRNELLQQLLKDPEDEKKQDTKVKEDDPLLRSLGFRNPSPISSQDHNAACLPQKRPGGDGEINFTTKRPMDGLQVVTSSASNNSNNTVNTSKLWEKNRMLASLLAKQPTQPATIPPIPASVISATPQDKLPRMLDRNKSQQQQIPHQQSWSSSVPQGASNSSTLSRNATPNSSRLLSRQINSTYFTQMQQQRLHAEQLDPEFLGNKDYRQGSTELVEWDMQGSSDPDLSEILDQVIEISPEGIAENSALASILDKVESQRNEKLAIKTIQESLMLIETAVNPTSSIVTMSNTPPTYSTALTSPSTSVQSYQPPPVYQQPQQTPQHQPRTRIVPQGVGIRQPGPQYSSHQQQMQLQQRSKMMQQQQQLKQRLLQQQQQQQLLIPSNATAPDQITTGIHNIDSLINNTVAPNVSLQRSTVSDQQTSSSYGGSVQMPTNHRLVHSYSHPSTIPQHSIASNTFNTSQHAASAAASLPSQSSAGIVSFSHAQSVSTRISQGNYAANPRMFNVNQVRQQQPGVQPPLQQQRSMSSPGTPVSARQSPFLAEAFPPPASPTASQFPPVASPSTQYRLQRTTSASATTTQLAGNPTNSGGINSEYVRKELRTVVDARMQQQQRTSSNLQSNLPGQVSQDDLDALGLNFDMTPTDYYGRNVQR